MHPTLYQMQVDELHINKLLGAPFFTDKCTDIATIEELSIYCRPVENRSSVEQFMEILPFKKKNIQCQKLVGMDFDGLQERILEFKHS